MEVDIVFIGVLIIAITIVGLLCGSFMLIKEIEEMEQNLYRHFKGGYSYYDQIERESEKRKKDRW